MPIMPVPFGNGGYFRRPENYPQMPMAEPEVPSIEEIEAMYPEEPAPEDAGAIGVPDEPDFGRL